MMRPIAAAFLLLLIACALHAQTRYRAVLDPTFDASSFELASPPQLRADASNRLYLADRGRATLFRLSADGRTSESLMREGAGPGEARGFSGMGWKGDTLWLYDNRLTRFTFLTPSGQFVRTNLYSDLCTTTLPWSLLAAGGCLEGVYTRNPYANAGDPIPGVPMIVTWGGKHPVDTIGLFSYEHSSMQFDRKNGKAFVPQPFGDDVIYGPTTGGTAVLEVRRRAAQSARPDSIMIRQWLAGRGWQQWHPVGYLPRSLTGQAVDSAIDVMFNRLDAGLQWITRDSLERKAYRPGFVPPVSGYLSTIENTVWIRLENASDLTGTSGWIVLDNDLMEKARVKAPSELHLLDARDGYCWGYVLDEDDVPHIHRYKLVQE